MNLVPPYDVICLHRRISTSWLCSSLFCFSPPTRIPRGLRAGGLVVGRSCLLVGGGGARTVRSKAAAVAAVVCLHQVWFCGCGREDLENRGGGANRPG